MSFASYAHTPFADSHPGDQVLLHERALLEREVVLVHRALERSRGDTS